MLKKKVYIYIYLKIDIRNTLKYYRFFLSQIKVNTITNNKELSSVMNNKKKIYK